ncbi:hypothetical protein [Methylobacterium sp. Leaf117]|uniref:hypothetical protein n=1 Tax=Methylobacterium sp. Leaf117 TaxID=1736260 RepID=UPI0006FFE3E2|nr:hypothetical protein [Methylobacterium sp. Leaf117]KQP91278.1 hypothetical protein ASF57_23210 [Methylobacterium sp. Leaf117]
MYLTPDKGAKTLKPAPAALLMRAGVYHLLDRRYVEIAVAPLLKFNPDTQSPHHPEDEPDIRLL